MDLLFWIYLINAIVLINHEIDSAYWQEWKLIRPDQKDGITGFLVIHFPMLFIILIGLVLVYDHRLSGYIISLLLAAGGLFAFFFHFYHLRKGKPEFNTMISIVMIVSTFVLSILQIILTVNKLLK
jgi:uncharacterized membrane protein